MYVKSASKPNIERAIPRFIPPIKLVYSSKIWRNKCPPAVYRFSVGIKENVWRKLVVLSSVVVDAEHHLPKVIAARHDACGARRVTDERYETDRKSTHSDDCGEQEKVSRA